MSDAKVDVPVALAGCIERLKRNQMKLITGSAEWQKQYDLINWLESKAADSDPDDNG